MTSLPSSAQQHRTTCALVLVLAAAAIVALLVMHDGSAAEQAAWLGVVIAMTAASTAPRGRCRHAARPEAAARR